MGCRWAQRGNLLETAVRKQRLPLLGRQQWRGRSQMRIAESPPAREQTECQLAGQGARGGLEKYEQARRRQQRSNMIQRSSKIFGRMQYMRGDNDVKRMG